MKSTRKPNSAMTAHHHSAIVTARHAARMRAGRVESRPEDYADIAVTEQAKRLRGKLIICKILSRGLS